MRRLVPVLIVATVLALIAAVGADHAAAPVPAAATAQTHSKSMQILHASTKHETPRQKAHRIISATWPASQVANAMRVVECESRYNQWAANLRGGGSG